MSLHLELADRIRQDFRAHLATPPQLRQDALLLELTDGTRVEIRYAAADAYLVRWGKGEALSCIDTAPCHPELSTFPNHLHAVDGSLQADPITRCGAEPWDNVRGVLQALIAADR